MLSQGNAIIFFLFTLYIHGVTSRPSFSLAIKRSRSVSSLAASLEYRTNAKRMAAGLQPLSPTRVFDSTRIVPRAAESPVLYSGAIIARKASDSAIVGSISKLLHSSGRLTLTPSLANRALISLSYVDSSTVLELKTTISDIPYIGAAGSMLASDNNNRNDIVLTGSVAAGLGPTQVGNSAASGAGGSESHIWMYNPSTTEITAIWVNPVGSTVTAYIYFENAGPNTGLHISAKAKLQGGFDRVKLYLAES